MSVLPIERSKSYERKSLMVCSNMFKGPHGVDIHRRGGGRTHFRCHSRHDVRHALPIGGHDGLEHRNSLSLAGPASRP